MRIIVSAKIANTTVGHIDHALAYAVGLQHLGHEVYLIDYAGRSRCQDKEGKAVPFRHWSGREHFQRVAQSYGLWPRACLVSAERETHGMSFSQAEQIARSADLLVTRSGKIHKLPEIFEAPLRRAFLDGNPGSTQTLFHQQDEDREPLERYENLFTLGFNIGSARSPIPCCGRVWHPLPRPVVLSMYPPRIIDDDSRFTTISSGRGRTTFELAGTFSGEKSDNWLEYLELPRRSGQQMEIALRSEGEQDGGEGEIFRDAGWLISDPGTLRTFADYYRFLAQSRAEFSVAHNRYVAFDTGWFSDRSAAYLACGKPVVVQATGIEPHLPVGTGILTFASLDEAVERIEAVNADYLRHARAARDIAEQYFAAPRVLNKMLAIVG